MTDKTYLKTTLAISLFSLLLIFSTTAHPKTIYVDDDAPADFSNIQAAIDDANNGDIIVVNPGIYTDDGNRDIDFFGKAIAVRSVDPNDPNIVAATIIDCNGTEEELHRGFYFQSGEGKDSVLNGFTIINGCADYGGAICCYRSSPSISSCIISNNWSVSIYPPPNNVYTGEGGGIYCQEADPVITNCTISRNFSDRSGGGIYCYLSNPVIKGCNIGNNGYIGIRCFDNSSPKITNCTIKNNSGPAIDCWEHCSPEITNCIINNNIGSWGAGIRCTYSCSPSISGCTFYRNWGFDEGCSIGCYSSSQAIITNSILWTSSNTENAGWEVSVYGDSSVTISYCDVKRGKAAVNVDDDSTLNWDIGNISVDPMICRDGFHIRADSPCINAGTTDDSVQSDETDMDGEPRVYDSRVDMGADEFIDSERDNLPDFWELKYFADPASGHPLDDPDADNRNNLAEYYLSSNPIVPTRNYYVDPVGGSDTWDGLSPIWEGGTRGPKAGIQTAIDVATTYGDDTIILAAATYRGKANRNIDFKGKYLTVRSTDPKDPDVVDATVIDCQKSGRGFKFTSGERRNSVLAGLTITNGSAPEELIYDWPHRVGGGIFCDHSSPTISNCVITGNSAPDSPNHGGGGGIYCYMGSSPVIEYCSIIGNFGDPYGGGIFCTGESNPVISYCIISKNISSYAPAVYCLYSRPTITNCSITNHTSTDGCGGIAGCGGPITNCIISNNKAKYYSAGALSGCYGPITNCIITGNSTPRDGGAMRNCIGPITNCIIAGNYAGGKGGAIYLYRRNTSKAFDLTIKNCTFVANSSPNGYALFLDSTNQSYPTNLQIINSILFNGGNEIRNNDNSNIMITYSDVQTGWPGKGNIDAYPYFVDAANGDYHLLPVSPCINTGDPNYIAEPNETDLEAKPRVMGGRIDMGPYEFISAEVRFLPRTINLLSKGKGITACIRLPENYNVTDIITNSILLQNKIKAESVQIDEGKQVLIATFSHEHLQEILNTGDIELTISGRLTGGDFFKAAEVITVINNSEPPKYIHATNPNPADGAMDVGLNDFLSWTPGRGAISHNVYFGTSSNPPFVCNQTAAIFDPGTLTYFTTYYWRIDEVTKWTIITGQIWSFTPFPQPPPW